MTTTSNAEFNLKILGVTKPQLCNLIVSLPSGTSFQIQTVKEAEPKPPHFRRTNGFLTMTGKSATEGSMRAQVLTAFEKLEGEHGIGKVNRAMIRDKCHDNSLDSQIIYQLLKDGYLEALR